MNCTKSHLNRVISDWGGKPVHKSAPWWLQVFAPTKQQHATLDSFHQRTRVFRQPIAQTFSACLVGTTEPGMVCPPLFSLIALAVSRRSGPVHFRLCARRATLPVGAVEFVLPLQPAVLRDAVVPQDQAARHALVHLVRQIPQEQRRVLRRRLLRGHAQR